MTIEPTADRRSEASEEPTPLERAIGEYLDRLNSGKTLDPREVLAEHPEHGHEILESLEGFVDFLGAGDEDRPVETLGDYTLRRQIGRGGMGVVYEAWENSMDRQVALKVLPTAIAADTKAVTRFVREAQMSGKLNHPNVVSIYGMGLKEQVPYYAMEYVAGETLGQIVARWKREGEAREGEASADLRAPTDLRGYLDLAKAFADAADGLQHAHSKGVVHRDIKPSNLILDAEGRLRILDFGLARFEGQESLTLSGDFVGTPAYMSPEQAKRKNNPIDHRTDIYSLGATLYELLTLQQPFRGKDHQDTLSKIIERDPRPPRQLNARVPVDLETIVLKCLRKDAGDRYHTAEALGQDLRRFVRQDPIEAQAQPFWEKTARRLWRQRRLGMVLVAVLIVGLLSSVVANVLIDRARDKAEEDLYVSNMRLAMEGWRAGNFVRFSGLLERHVPEADERDLRGWEWYYLYALSRQEELAFDGHLGAVYAVAWSPDGKHLASAGDDGKVKIWLPETGEVAHTLSHESSVDMLAWSLDSGHLAASDREGLVTIWSPENEEIAWREPRGKALPSWWWMSLSWSRDGRLAISDSGRTVKIVSASGEVEEVFQGNSRHTGVAWSPNGRWLAVGRHDGNISILGKGAGTNWAELNLIPGQSSLAMAWSPDSRFLATGHKRAVRVFDREKSYESFDLSGHKGSVHSLSWSPDGEFASAAFDGTARIWDTSARREVAIVRGHAGAVHSVSFGPHGERLATASADGTVKIWARSLQAECATLESGKFVTWSADNKYIAARRRQEDFADGRGTVIVYDARSLEKVTTLGRKSCLGLAFSPVSDLLAVTMRHGRVRVWKVSTAETYRTFRTPDWQLRPVVWSPDGERLASGGTARGRTAGVVHIWDLAGGAELLAVKHPRDIVALAWSPRGEVLAAVSSDGALKLWDVATGASIAERELDVRFRQAYFTDPNILAWGPGRDVLAAGSATGNVRFLDSALKDAWPPLKGHAARIGAIDWSPDGERLATGSHDGTAKIWDPLTGDELLTLQGHESGVRDVAWSPDGSRLATCGFETLKIWDATSGNEMATARSWEDD